jgi:hypothetical protein
MENSVFTLNTEIHNDQEFLDSIVNGSAYIPCKVLGYWPAVSMRMHIRRGYSFEKTWKVGISHSAGGRDTKAVESDVDAEMNFGVGLIALANYAKVIETQFDKFEEIYQKQVAFNAAEYARERAERQAKVDADPVIDQKLAKKLVAKLIKDETPFQLAKVGTDKVVKVTIAKTYGNRKIYIGDGDVSRVALLKVLETASAKNTF